MINGVLENLDISWEERLGDGMRVVSEGSIEDIVFKHERKDKHTLATALIKDGQPYHIDTYETDHTGMLRKTTVQLIGKQPHWIYKYEIINGNLRVTRINDSGEVIIYNMIIIESDKNGRIKRAEYREVKTNILYGTLYCERDGNGKLKTETFEEDVARMATHIDAAGRYLKMEFFERGKLTATMVYKH